MGYLWGIFWISSGYFKDILGTIGPFVLYSIGPLVNWSSGPLVYWSMVHWSVGPFDYWFIGPLVECQMLNVNKVNFLSERTSGVPLVIFVIYTAINWMIYVSWRVYLHPSCSGSGNMHFLIYLLVLDICCQQLRDICQSEGVCDSVCPLVAELGSMHFVIY